MKFGCLFAVKDIKAARAFYEELFGLTVIDDFGLNIMFDCGLSLQQEFDWLTGIPKEEIKSKENNCEIYFESVAFDDFVSRLKSRGDINFLHDVIVYPWGQRVIRLYDLDEHLIEVGESMKAVVERFQENGMTIAEIAEKMGASEEAVYRMLKEQ